MKRSDELAPLSRDHQHGLSAALTLRRAVEANADAAREAFLAFWDTEGAHHFRVEEDVLLPSFARRGRADHPAVIRVLVEHVDLRGRAQELAENETPALATLHELGERLQSHIRHEEETIFPLIEQTLSSHELQALGAAIEQAERAHAEAIDPPRISR